MRPITRFPRWGDIWHAAPNNDVDRGAHAMLTRRNLLVASAAGIASSSFDPSADAATPANILVMAKAIDSIVGAFDPAQSYETANNEACGNIYRKLIIPDPADANKLVGDLAESWQVSKDGLVFTFQLRRGVKFDNGNELTAEDAAFSLQRVVKLNKTPGFILTQFGWNADNVERMIRATADHTLELTLPVVQRRPSGCTACRHQSAAWSRKRAPLRTRSTTTSATSGSRPTVPVPAAIAWSSGRRATTSSWKRTRTPR